MPNIRRKICQSLDLASNSAPLRRQWWSSHAIGLFLAKDASYGTAAMREKDMGEVDGRKGEAGEGLKREKQKTNEEKEKHLNSR